MTASLVRSAERKLIPLVVAGFALIFVNYIDRTNLSLASTHLVKALNLTPEQYGLTSSIFLAPYAAFQVPAVMLANRFAAGPLALGVMIIAWGITGAATAAVTNAAGLLGLRFMLGLFEAGALPCLWGYLSHIYPPARSTLPIGIIASAGAVGNAVGPALATAIFQMDGAAGVQGWQWLFIVEGAMAIIVGICWLFMPRNLEGYRNLSCEEVTAVKAMCKKGDGASMGSQVAALRAAVGSRVVWACSVIQFVHLTCFFAWFHWLPLLMSSVRGDGSFEHTAGSNKAKESATTLLLTIPYALAAVMQLLNAWSSQRVGERRFHITGTWAFGTVVLALVPLTLGSEAAAIALVTLASIGIQSANGITVTHFMSMQGGEKGIGIAIINSCGAVGGLVTSYVVGALKSATHDYAAGIWLVTGVLGLATILIGLLNPAWAEKYSAQRQGLLQLADDDATSTGEASTQHDNETVVEITLNGLTAGKQ